MDSASCRAVVPGSSSLVEPSGSRTVTAAMGLPFSIRAQGSIRWPPDAARPQMWSARPDYRVTPRSAAPPDHRTPGGGLVVEGPQRGRRIQVVVERGPDQFETVVGPDPGDVRVGVGTRGRAPGLEASGGPGHVVVRPFPIGTVVVVEQGQSHHVGVPLLQQVAHEDQIAERLGHLGAVQTDQPDVEPVAHEGTAGDRLGLRRLALVMGEDQIAAATVYVEGLPQLAKGQRRTFDVPSGTARSPTRLPRGLIGQRGLPQDEVEGMALVGVVGVTAVLGGQGQHGGRVEVAHRTERREGGDVEVDRPAGLVGVAGIEDRADQGEDLGDGRGGPRLGPRRDQAQCRHVGVEPADLLGGQVEEVDSELPGLAQDVVVDVGDVAYAARSRGRGRAVDAGGCRRSDRPGRARGGPSRTG